MLRVTIELVPYGTEELAKTISEVCIANVHTDKDNMATYAAAGYHDKYGKIEEFGVLVQDFPRNDGVLELMRKIFSAEKVTLHEILAGEELMKKTRLFAVAEGDEADVDIH